MGAILSFIWRWHSVDALEHADTSGSTANAEGRCIRRGFFLQQGVATGQKHQRRQESLLNNPDILI